MNKLLLIMYAFWPHPAEDLEKSTTTSKYYLAAKRSFQEPLSRFFYNIIVHWYPALIFTLGFWIGN